MKNSISIRKMILAISSVLLLVIMGQGVYTFVGSQNIRAGSEKIETSSENIEKKIFPASIYSQKLTSQFDVLWSKASKAYDLGENGGESFAEDFDNDGQDLPKLIDSIAKYDKSPKVASMKKKYDEFFETTQEVLEAKINGEEVETPLAEIQAKVSDFKNLVQEVGKDNVKATGAEFGGIKEQAAGTSGLAEQFILIAAVIFVILIGVVSYFLVYVRALVRSIRNLASDANEIRNGNMDHQVVQTRGDEMGDLQNSFDLMRREVKDFIENLDQKVQERTREVMEEKRKVSDLLNNMTQAVFKIDASLNVVPPVSAYAEAVFGEAIEGRPIFETLYSGLAPRSEDRVALDTAFIAVFGEDDMQWDLSVDNLVTRVVRPKGEESQVLKVSYAPLWDADDTLQEIMLVVEDVTELERLAMEKKKNEESITMIQELSVINLADLKDYFVSSSRLARDVQDLLDAGHFNVDTLGLMFRHLHTLKGNSRVFGLSLVGSAVHIAESHVNVALEEVRAGRSIDAETMNLVQIELLESHRKLNTYAEVANRIFKLGLDYQRDLMREFELDLSMVDNLLMSSPELSLATLSTKGLSGHLERLAKNCVLLNDAALEEKAARLTAMVESDGLRDTFKTAYQNFFATFVERHGSELKNVASDHTPEFVDVSVNLLKIEQLFTSGNVDGARILWDSTHSMAEVRGMDFLASAMEGQLSKATLTQSLQYTALMLSVNLRSMLSHAESQKMLDIFGRKDKAEIQKFLGQTLLKDTYPFSFFRMLQKEDLDVAVALNTLAEMSGFTSAVEMLDLDSYTDIESLMTSVSSLAVNGEGREHEFVKNPASPVEKIIGKLLVSRNSRFDMLFIMELIGLIQYASDLRDRQNDGVERRIPVNANKYAQLEAILASCKTESKTAEQVYLVYQQLTYADVASSMTKYRSMVTDLARKLGKQIEFVVEGDPVAMKHERLNILQDALVHMVRNSVDHGIELPNVRVSAGKYEKGTLRISLSEEERRVRLILADDGGGIDAERVYAKAKERGAIPADAELSHAEKLMLIFLPNLSTKDEITDLSGRGVGMDVVKKNIEESLGGTVRIESELGKGSRFIIELDQ